MSPAHAAAGCATATRAATTAARPTRNARIPSSSPGIAGDVGMTLTGQGGSLSSASAVEESAVLFHQWKRGLLLAEAGGHHRENDRRADEKLEIAEATDPLPERGHLGRGRGVASGGPGTDREELEGPARDRRTGRRVDPHGEHDPGEDRPRPARVQ